MRRIVLFGVLLATPFVFLRVFYAMLAVFPDMGSFEVWNGSAMARLGMWVGEEMVVVVFDVGDGVFATVEGGEVEGTAAAGIEGRG